MNRLNDEPQSDIFRGRISGPTVVVVLVEPHETKEKAWRRHLKKNPQDLLADIRIFHIAHPGNA